MSLTCTHLGEPLGSRRDSLGLEIEHRCRHRQHEQTTICACLLCEHYLRPISPESASMASNATGKRSACPHPLGMVVDRFGADAGVADLYKGSAGFLVLGGPSAKKMPLDLLNQRGCLLLSVNNCPSVLPSPIRPHIWLHTDPCRKFHDSIWRDPAILKFTPIREWDLGRKNKRALRTRDASGQIAAIDGVCARNMPGVFGFERSSGFEPEAWLFEATINRGNDKQHAEGEKGCTKNGWPNVINTMFSAIRLAFFLGVNPLYLVGADFRMDEEEPYGFGQGKSKGGVAANNFAYAKIDHMLRALLPYFANVGFQVFNCTPGSALWAFPQKDFQEAVTEVTAGFEKEMNCNGWYDSIDSE